MVDNDITGLVASESVRLSPALVAHSETEVAHYGVVGPQRHLMAGYAYPLSGSRLPGKSEVAGGDAQGGVEKYGAGDIEHHCAGAFLHHGMTQRAGPVTVLKGGDMIHLAATASGRVTPETLGPGKCYERTAGICGAGQEERGDKRDYLHGLHI